MSGFVEVGIHRLGMLLSCFGFFALAVVAALYGSDSLLVGFACGVGFTLCVFVLKAWNAPPYSAERD